VKKIEKQINMLADNKIVEHQTNNIKAQIDRAFILLKEIQQTQDTTKIKHLEKLFCNVSTALGIDKGQYNLS
jgi:hypothetical protein